MVRGAGEAGEDDGCQLRECWECWVKPPDSHQISERTERLTTPRRSELFYGDSVLDATLGLQINLS